MTLLERRPGETPNIHVSRLIALLTLIGAFLLLGACQGSSRSEEQQVPPPSAGEPVLASELPTTIERSPGPIPARYLTVGESHSYQVSLETGEYVHLVVDQQGVDVVCELSRADGESVLRVDSRAAAWGPEELFWIAERPSDFHLVIRALRVEKEGRYTLELRSLSPAQETQYQRVRAARLFDAAERLRSAGVASQDDAVHLFEQARALWHQLGERNGEAEVLYRLGLIRARSNEWPEAIEYFERTEPLFAVAGNVRMRSAALQQIGQSNYRAGEIEGAIPSYQEALRLRMELGDRRWQAVTLHNLGHAKAILGEFQEALTLYDQALERWREIGERVEEANTLHGRGKCYLYLGQFQQALDDLNRALEIREELGDRKAQAMTLNGLALVHEELARYGKSEEYSTAANGSFIRALDLLKRAHEISVGIGNRRYQAITLSIMGRVYSHLGEQSKALGAFTQALEIHRQQGNSQREAFVLYEMGSFLFSIGQTDESLDHLRQALPLLESTGRQHEVDALAKIASAERRRGNLETAVEYIVKAVDKTEALRAKPASYGLRSSFFALRQNYYDLYIEFLMELHRREPEAGYDARALEVSERARARSLLEALLESGSDLRRGADPELLARERSLEDGINSKELQRLRLLDEEASAPQTAVVEQELRTLLREYEQAQAKIRLSSPTYTALTQPSPLDAEEVRRLVLDDQTLLLQYKLGTESSYLWAMDRDSMSSFELPGRATVESLAHRVYDLLVVSNRRESRLPIQSALANLSEMLIHPVAHLLEGRRLLVVSEGALQYIPFGALPMPASAAQDPRDPDPSAAGTPLLATHEVTYMPSASTLAELRRRLAQRPRAPGWVAVVADPVFQRHDPRIRGASEMSSANSRGSTDLRRFERLVFSEQEAAAILDLVPADRSYQALGFAANLDTVTGGDLSRYQIIHFATHGYVDAEQPELSRLVLSLFDEQRQPQNGFLFAHEIYNLELPAELVVLSACRTALGKRVRGEGLVGLTQAFMYAGAARVLVSLWPVNDQATAELMARFYRHLLRDRLAPADALGQAKLSIAREKRWQAPYYWAGFVLQGEW